MQQRNLGKAMRCLVAVCVLVSSLAMFACGGDDDEGEVKNVIATVPVNNSTVAAVQGRAITIQQGQVFGGTFSGTVTLTFTLVPNAFTLTTSGGTTTTGTVNYGSNGSCTFIPTTGGAFAVETCNFIVNASNVVVGTGQVSGTITLVLNSTVQGVKVTVNSGPLTATVFINGSGELFVVNSVTGVSVDMGIQP